MNYTYNESGDIKVRDEKGFEKWLPKHLVEDKFLMKGKKFSIVYAPVKPELDQEELEVAENAPAKSGKTKTK